MNSSKSRPKWWQLFLALPALAAFVVIDTRMTASTGGHQALQFAALLGVAGWVRTWMRLNASALRHMDDDAHARSLVVHTYALPQTSTMQAPESELHPALEPVTKPASDRPSLLARGLRSESRMAFK
jgi:hypothetical protein